MQIATIMIICYTRICTHLLVYNIVCLPYTSDKTLEFISVGLFTLTLKLLKLFYLVLYNYILKTSLSSLSFPWWTFQKGKSLLSIEILLFYTIDHFTKFGIKMKFSISTLLLLWLQAMDEQELEAQMQH